MVFSRPLCRPAKLFSVPQPPTLRMLTEQEIVQQLLGCGVPQEKRGLLPFANWLHQVITTFNSNGFALDSELGLNLARDGHQRSSLARQLSCQQATGSCPFPNPSAVEASITSPDSGARSCPFPTQTGGRRGRQRCSIRCRQR